MLIAIHQHMLNETPIGAMTIPWLTIKGPKVGGGTIPGYPHLPQNSWNTSPTHQSMKLPTNIKTETP